MGIMDKMRTNMRDWLLTGMSGGGSLTNMSENSRTLEYDVWYKGKEEELARFYTNFNWNEQYVRVKENYLYANTLDTERIVHSGIPRLVADTMARLIFSGGVDIAEENAQDTLDAIIKDNRMNKQHAEGGSLESGYGKFAYKLSYDSDLSEWTIIETIKACDYDTLKVRERIQEFHFFTAFEEDNKKYRLTEIYGKGYIDYKLERKSGTEWKPASLTATRFTSELTRVEFTPKVILAMEKTNKTIEGRSDYEGLISEFDTLDEFWSSFSEEGRNAKVEKYVDEAFLNNGQIPPRIAKNYYRLSTHPDKEVKIDYQQPDFRADTWSEGIKVVIDNVLLNVGLSPATVGIDNAGGNTSAESRRVMERSSLRTRAERIELWDEFLTEFYELVLIAQDIFTKSTVGKYEVVVQFGEYIVDTLEDRVKAVKELTFSQVIDTEFALEMVFGDTIDDKTRKRILQNLGEEVVEEVTEEDDE